MKKSWAIALTLVAASAQAEVTLETFGVHIASVHSNSYDSVAKRNWNNSNPGVYGIAKVEGVHPWADGRYVTGVYYNSVRQTSVYAGRVFAVTDYLDIVVGVVTGYDRPGSKTGALVPLVVPSFHYGPVRLTIVPKVEKGGAAAVNLALEYKF